MSHEPMASLNPIPLKLFKTEDPVMRIGNEREYSVYKGAGEIAYYQFPTSGTPSLGINTILCNPNNRRTVIDRKCYLEAQFVLSFTGTAGQTGITPLLIAGYDAPRCNPLAKCMQSLSVKIGEQSVTSQPNQYISYIERYAQDHFVEDHDYSITPSMPDQYTNYSLSALNNNSELGSYGDDPSQCPRGFAAGSTGSVWYSITQTAVGTGSGTPAPAGATASVLLTVMEPLYISPLFFGKGEQSGLIGVESFSIAVQFDGSCSRLWSHSTNVFATVNAPTVAINYLKVHVRQLTPNLIQEVPSQLVYPYSNMGVNANGNTVSVTSGATFSVNYNTIVLSTIPTRLVILARIADASASFTTTDTFAVIQSVQVLLGNRVLLTTATAYDLYLMAVRNGCNLSWFQWNTIGSPLAIDFSKDIGLAATEAPSLSTKANLQVKVTFLNTNLNTIVYQPYIFVIEEGTMTISNGQMVTSLGVLSQKDILDAEKALEMPYKQDRNVYGGAWYDDLWHGIKKVYNVAAPIAKAVAPVVKKALPASEPYLSAVGLGLEGAGVSGGKRGKSKKPTKKELEHMLRNQMAEMHEMRAQGRSGGRMISREDL